MARRLELCQEFMELVNINTSMNPSTVYAKGERIFSKLRGMGTTLDDIFHDWYIAFATKHEPGWASKRFKGFRATGTVVNPDIKNLDVKEVMQDLLQYKKDIASTRALQKSRGPTPRSRTLPPKLSGSKSGINNTSAVQYLP
ncbi:hypothetical protein Plec18170_006060 [Paecilomyces lecythidis]